MPLARQSFATFLTNLAATAAFCAVRLFANQALAAEAAQQAVIAQPGAEPTANNAEPQDPAPPSESLFSQTYQACMDEAAGTTTAMQDCMAAEQERLETRMAAQRNRVTPTLNPERAKAFTEALGAWDTLRKSGSLAMYDPDGGTLSPLMASLWYLEQTARMTRWVDGMLENAEP